MLSLPNILSQASTPKVTGQVRFLKSSELEPVLNHNPIYLHQSNTPKVHQSYDFSTRKISGKKEKTQNEEIKMIENKVNELKKL